MQWVGGAAAKYGTCGSYVAWASMLFLSTVSHHPSSRKKSFCMPLACASFTSALKMESVCSSETSVNFNQTAWCHIPEDRLFSTYECTKIILGDHRVIVEQEIKVLGTCLSPPSEVMVTLMMERERVLETLAFTSVMMHLTHLTARSDLNAFILIKASELTIYMCLGKHALGMVNSYNTLFTVI
jgi:hypothetical protein